MVSRRFIVILRQVALGLSIGLLVLLGLRQYVWHTTAAPETYVRAITHPDDRTFQRLDCPAPDLRRYEHLRSPSLSTLSTSSSSSTPARDSHGDGDGVRFFFALDLRECVYILPRLLGSVVEAMRFLGPARCALSVVVGNSADGTEEVLRALRPALDSLGAAAYFLEHSDINPGAGDRIARLAALRNLALAPLVERRVAVSDETDVVFLNDVSICLEDILELVHQRVLQGADMTCAMDWAVFGPDPTFYDSWIARTLRGDLFFDVPPTRAWRYALDLFWNDHGARRRFDRRLPFQVFSCWNGAVVFAAGPLLSAGLAFRASAPGECPQGEPQLFCKDLWYAGRGRIATVPSVNLGYTDDHGRKIKSAIGYVSDLVADSDEEKIDWVLDPPEQVRCVVEGWKVQSWMPWNESLPL